MRLTARTIESATNILRTLDPAFPNSVQRADGFSAAGTQVGLLLSISSASLQFERKHLKLSQDSQD